MAATQLTASTISTKGFLSFEGLRASSGCVKVSSFAPLGQNGISRRLFRGLVVKAATTVAPKVFLSLYSFRFPHNFTLRSAVFLWIALKFHCLNSKMNYFLLLVDC